MGDKCYLRRLPLTGAKNTRDIGGYACSGGCVRWGRFLRSDCPNCLTKEDVEYLREYGVTDTIDLRRIDELQKNPSVLIFEKGFISHQISLHNNSHSTNYEGDEPGSMSGMYIELLDDAQGEMAQVFRALANAKGVAFFHCAVGKDRTGVVAMLLLKLAGVEDDDVAADYAVTDIYMQEIFDAQQGVFSHMDIPEYILKSRPISIFRVLRHLKDTYGTAKEYLLKCGLSNAEIDELLKKLVG